MNYLGHAYLSPGEPGILAGNLFADEIKGLKSLEKYPRAIIKGILLHRRIDEFTDSRPACKAAKLIFRSKYGLWSGAITDTIFDHFLANDPARFNTQNDLTAFSLKVYQTLDAFAAYLPPKFAVAFPHMKSRNWLYHYSTVAGIKYSLQSLTKKSVSIPPMQEAYELFLTNYYFLNNTYYELIEDVIKFTDVYCVENNLINQ